MVNNDEPFSSSLLISDCSYESRNDHLHGSGQGREYVSPQLDSAGTKQWIDRRRGADQVRLASGRLVPCRQALFRPRLSENAGGHDLGRNPGEVAH